VGEDVVGETGENLFEDGCDGEGLGEARHLHGLEKH
jgi:hypothetical protein